LNEDDILWFNDPDGKIQREPDPEKRLLLAVVHHLDHAIGQLVNALSETGQRESTLILFSSDNGPQVTWNGNAYPHDLNLTDFNQPIPMRGSKCDVWEGGIHVPGFANWPGRIESKTVTDPVHIIDWFPTLTALTGAKVNADLDGIDLSPVLFGKQSLPERELYWIWHPRTNRWALRRGDWKIVRYGTKQPKAALDWQLFNLKEDPKEQRDVSDEYLQRARQLHQLFLKQRAEDQLQ
jgi:arylsulfatase A-like enzyme